MSRSERDANEALAQAADARRRQDWKVGTPPALPPLDPSVVDVSTITEYGLKQKLSMPIRCF